MVPRPNYASYKGIQSKHSKTHKGIKDQKSDSSESPLGDIRQKNMKELEYEEQSHIEHFGCPYSPLPPPQPFNFEHAYSPKNEMRWSIVLLSGGRVFKVWCEMNCRWVSWLDPVFLLLVLDSLVSLNQEIAAGEHIDWAYRAPPRLAGGSSYTQGRGWDLFAKMRPCGGRHWNLLFWEMELSFSL